MGTNSLKAVGCRQQTFVGGDLPQPTHVCVSESLDASRLFLVSVYLQSVVRLLQLLHERDARLQFMARDFWSNHQRKVVVNRQVIIAHFATFVASMHNCSVVA